ncbi:glucoamylase [Candidatus Woesearchaeota archaeon]|nr:glucoamylase [Candidatus Woesearchaeota archaeon]
MHKEAKKALDFVLKGQLDSGAFPQRYDAKGNDASYKPIQIDGTGLIIYSFTKYVLAVNNEKFLDMNWHKIQKAVNYIKQNFHEDKNLIYTPNSIHEFPPMERGLEIWANSVCCAAIKELCEVTKKYKKNNREWAELTHQIQSGIEKYLWNSRVNYFIKVIRIKESSSVDIDIDASQLALCEFGIISDNDKRMKSTIKKMEKDLWNKQLGGLCRYHKYEGRNNGGWGPWPHFTLMLCRHFIRLKNKKKADKCLDWVLKIAYKGMLPEHISTVSEFEEYVTDFTEAGLLRKDRLILIGNARKHPMFKKGIAYITIPLAWPHAEFIITWNLYKKVF